MNAFASGDPRLLLRADLRDFDGYRSARSERVQGEVWLNANEACVPNVSDSVDALRRYPAPRPEALVDALASLYDCPPAHLLVGRGSDELIDLLVRACCMRIRPYGLVLLLALAAQTAIAAATTSRAK